MCEVAGEHLAAIQQQRHAVGRVAGCVHQLPRDIEIGQLVATRRDRDYVIVVERDRRDKEPGNDRGLFAPNFWANESVFQGAEDGGSGGSQLHARKRHSPNFQDGRHLLCDPQ